MELARPLRAQAQASHRLDSDTYVAHALRGDGFDASEDGTGSGSVITGLLCAHASGLWLGALLFSPLNPSRKEG